MNYTNQFSSKSPKQISTIIRTVLAALLMVTFYLQTSALEPHTPGSALYVTAQSGLHMRTSPDVMANSLKIVPHGEQVFVTEDTASIQSQKIDWVAGQWLLVEHDGDTGYIFDGFLSRLNVPTYEWEKCQLDMDLIYPLENWAEVNHFVDKTDTSVGTFITKVSELYTDGSKLVKINSGNIYKIELYLTDIRVMDAYHLLQSMLDGKPSIRTFQNQSVFIEAADSSELQRVKIKLDNPVDIRKLENGTVKISIHSQEYECTL